MSAIPRKVRETVEERAGGRCERCGRAGPVELHHRKYRSRGGAHTVQNLVALCGWGNHTGCHGFAHRSRDAQTVGLTVSSWDDEREARLAHYERGLVYLDSGGSYSDTPDLGM